MANCIRIGGRSFALRIVIAAPGGQLEPAGKQCLPVQSQRRTSMSRLSLILATALVATVASPPPAMADKKTDAVVAGAILGALIEVVRLL